MFQSRWSILSNISSWGPQVGDSIWVFWNPLLQKARLLLITTQLIHMEFINLGGLMIFVTLHIDGAQLQKERHYGKISVGSCHARLDLQLLLQI